MDEEQAARTKITSYWNALSGAYDDAPDHRVRSADEQAAWLAILRAILPAPPANALDLGTGTGFLALLLAELGYDVLGVDIAEGMIAVARQKAAPLPQPPRFVVGDAGTPPVAPAGVEIVVSRHLLWTLPDPLGALRNWHRALRPGGCLVVIDGLWGAQTGAADQDEPDWPDEPEDDAYTTYYTPAVQAQLPLLRARALDPVFALIAEAGFTDPVLASLESLARAGRRVHPGSFIITATKTR